MVSGIMLFTLLRIYIYFGFEVWMNFIQQISLGMLIIGIIVEEESKWW